MGRVADKASISYQLLNKRKGRAVQSLRAQVDRDIYKSTMQAHLAEQPNLEILEDG